MFLTDEENGLRIIVSRLGAELISLARMDEAGEWIGFLYRDDDLSTPPTRLGESRHRHGLLSSPAEEWPQFYRGHEIKGGTHSFLRSKTWHLAGSRTKRSGASLNYRITPEDFSPIEYPLKVSLDLTYRDRALTR